MTRPFDHQQSHTLAQFARRAGISEGRARALYTATPSGLPSSDRTDVDGRPLWWASTIDAWCARTGRAVSDESLWLYRAPAATGPAVELRRGLVTLDGYRWAHTFYVIVWDTEHGHVLYLQPLDKGGEHKDWVAVHAAELIEPRWWSTAAVVMPMEEDLGHRLTAKPFAYVYRLTTKADTEDESARPGGLRRWFQRDPAPAAPVEPKAVWSGQMDLADIAKVVGRPVPLWLAGTETSANATQTLSYDRTFTVPDTVTSWPAAERRLHEAIKAGMPAEFPAAFAALAADAADGLGALRTAHGRFPDSGDGWYLVCRPARPAPPVDLEQRLTGATLVTDTRLVAAELTELRAIEGDLDRDDPRGDAYAEAVTLLESQLRQAAKTNGTVRGLNTGFVPVADDRPGTLQAPWEGPVVDAWRRTLTPVTDHQPVLRLRRIRRLLDTLEPDQVREIYRDPDGRYVLVAELASGELWCMAEWPASLDTVATWTSKTVLAADDTGSCAAMLALTPTDDGRMRVDPVPLPPRSSREAFGYGYGGGTPSSTHLAILRCALGDIPDLAKVHELIGEYRDDAPVSQLWAAISTTHGPLRLPWQQVQRWADTDHTASRFATRP